MYVEQNERFIWSYYGHCARTQLAEISTTQKYKTLESQGAKPQPFSKNHRNASIYNTSERPTNTFLKKKIAMV